MHGASNEGESCAPEEGGVSDEIESRAIGASNEGESCAPEEGGVSDEIESLSDWGIY